MSKSKDFYIKIGNKPLLFQFYPVPEKDEAGIMITAGENGRVYSNLSSKELDELGDYFKMMANKSMSPKHNLKG